MSWLLTLSASSSVLPLTISVSADDEAMAEPQPKVWKCAARMMSVSGSTLSIRRSASPQEIDRRRRFRSRLPAPSVARLKEMLFDFFRVVPHGKLLVSKIA